MTAPAEAVRWHADLHAITLTAWHDQEVVETYRRTITALRWRGDHWAADRLYQELINYQQQGVL